MNSRMEKAFMIAGIILVIISMIGNIFTDNPIYNLLISIWFIGWSAYMVKVTEHKTVWGIVGVIYIVNLVLRIIEMVA